MNTTKRFHVWIARGPWAASAVFWARDEEDAKSRAAALWTRCQPADLACHLKSECARKGC